MKKSSVLIAGLSLAVSSYTGAASLDVDINDDTLRGQFNLSDANAALGLSGAIMLTDDRGEVYSLTARTQGELPDQPFIKGGFGGRAYHASPDGGDSFQALGIGGFINITVPKVEDLSFGVELYYAPSITVTDDLDNFFDLEFRVNYQLFQNAAVYGGFRNVEVEVGDFDYEFADGAHVGFTLQF